MTPRPTSLLSAASPGALAFGEPGSASSPPVQVVPKIAANSPAEEAVEGLRTDGAASAATTPAPAVPLVPGADSGADPGHATTPTGSFAINGLSRWPASLRWRALLNLKP